MKLSELKTALKRYGFDDTDPLSTWINAAYHEIENAFEKWSFLETEETIETAEQSFNLVGSVNRMIKLRDITTEATTGGEGYDLEYMDRRSFEREFPNLNESGNPEYFTIIGSSKIQVYPDPPAKRKYRATYIKKVVDLAAETDVPVIPEANHYTIVRGAAYVALQAENEEERAASAQGQFETDLQKMITNDMIRQVGAPNVVVDAQGYTDG